MVDSSPDFPVLNLAQAVVVCCYELMPAIRGAGSAGDSSDSSSGNASSSGSGVVSSESSGGGDGGVSRSGSSSGSGISGSSVSEDGGGVSRSGSGSSFRSDLANDQELATLGDSEGLLQRLFGELEDAGYFEVETRKPSTQVRPDQTCVRVCAVDSCFEYGKEKPAAWGVEDAGYFEVETRKPSTQVRFRKWSWNCVG